MFSTFAQIELRAFKVLSGRSLVFALEGDKIFLELLVLDVADVVLVFFYPDVKALILFSLFSFLFSLFSFLFSLFSPFDGFEETFRELGQDSTASVNSCGTISCHRT